MPTEVMVEEEMRSAAGSLGLAAGDAQAAEAAAAAAAAARTGHLPYVITTSSVFARSPALLIGDNLLDYRTPEGMEVYKEGKKSLHPERKMKFGLSHEDKTLLIKELQERCDEMGMRYLFEVHQNPNVPISTVDDMLTTPGVIPLGRCKTYALWHVNSETRADQDNHIIYKALRGSMTREALAVIDKKKKEYTIRGHPSAIYFLKIYIQQSALDTNQTPQVARTCLTQLETIMVDVKFDIKRFNEHIGDQIAAIDAHNQDYNAHDLFMHAMNGLRQIPDDRFQRWCDRRDDTYNEGTATDPIVMLDSAHKEYQARMLRKD